MSGYTLEDYDRARAELARWNEAWDSYTGNNPEKYRGDVMAALRKVREIEASLKNAGLLELTEQERLDLELSRTFPNAQSKEVVAYEVKQYRLRFYPLEKSRSGKTVTEWGRRWELAG